MRAQAWGANISTHAAQPQTSCAGRSPAARPPKAPGEQSEPQAQCDAALDAEEAMRDLAPAPRSGSEGRLRLPLMS